MTTVVPRPNSLDSPPAPPLPRAKTATLLYTPAQAFAQRATLTLFIVAPFIALIIAVPVMWGWGLSWLDLALFLFFYGATGHGITVGFHRLFTHSSFKAHRAVKITLAVAGSMAVEGPVTRWVADHRRHHAYSDKDGDPHSPWRFGQSVPALIKGLCWAHLGWMYDREHTNIARYAPDLVKDKDIQRISRTFGLWVTVSLLTPALLGGLITMSWHGALTAFFWASLVRVGLLHHVTWSINSICHAAGARPFRSHDKSGNIWWLAVPSFGESWHNLHHADPTSARHGVLPGQIDTSARLIWLLERAGLARDVRWPRPERLADKQV